MTISKLIVFQPRELSFTFLLFIQSSMEKNHFMCIKLAQHLQNEANIKALGQCPNSS